MKQPFWCLLALILALHHVTAAQTDVPIRQSSRMVGGSGDGTRSYQPLDDERPFVERVTEKRIDLWARIQMPKPSNISDEEWREMEARSLETKKALIPPDVYELTKQVDEYVGWFGIVRANEFDSSKGETRFVVEHKYFDHLTDLRLHIVSIYGGGDFEVVLPGLVTGKQIPPLSLICVYGRVERGASDRVRLKADYVRVWDWGLFSFMDYGFDKSNPEWVKLRKVTGPFVYSPEVTQDFYEQRLGKR